MPRSSLHALVGSALLIALWAHAGPATAPDDPATAVLEPETRVLLIREMQALADAMKRIHEALVVGDHVTIADQARRIHDSFVLDQALTGAQRQEILSRLPEDFLDQDRRLHTLAGELAEAGRRRDPDLTRFWFEEATRACQTCHRDFAASRFPGLLRPEPAGDAHD